MTIDVGQALGDYRILSALGTSGSAEEFLVEHLADESRYALTVFATARFDDEPARAQFRDAAARIAGLHHPHIVQLHDYGCIDIGCYVVADYVTGPQGRRQTLESLLRRHPHGLRSDRIARVWAGQILAALQCAHEAGVMHHALRPACILLDGDGSLRLSHFGLQDLLGPDDGASQAGPAPADPPGFETCDFAAPEQAAGERADARADLYAFGMLLYRIVRGRPSDAPGANGAEAPMIPPPLDRIIARCTARHAGDRYASAAEILEDLLHPSAPRTRTLTASVALPAPAVAPTAPAVAPAVAAPREAPPHDSPAPPPASPGLRTMRPRLAPDRPSWRIPVLVAVLAVAAVALRVATCDSTTKPPGDASASRVPESSSSSAADPADRAIEQALSAIDADAARGRVRPALDRLASQFEHWIHDDETDFCDASRSVDDLCRRQPALARGAPLLVEELRRQLRARCEQQQAWHRLVAESSNNAIARSARIDRVESFIRHSPNRAYVAKARQLLARLRRGESASVRQERAGQ